MLPWLWITQLHISLKLGLSAHLNQILGLCRCLQLSGVGYKDTIISRVPSCKNTFEFHGVAKKTTLFVFI